VTTALSPEVAKELFQRARPSRAARRIVGEHRRLEVPLEAHSSVPPLGARRDSLAILRGQEVVRNADLVPLRYERMATDAFAYLRGAAAVMASDLAMMPNSGIRVQLCGDAHLANFGMFASAERSLVFDLNDFDETLPGPFEWDVKRLAASFAIAARNNGFSESDIVQAGQSVAQSYREWITAFSERATLDVWYARVDVDWMVSQLKKSDIRKALVKASDKAKRKNADSAILKLTEVVDGKRRFRSDPPILTPVADGEFGSVIDLLAPVYADYVSTLQPDRAALLARYSFVDFAFKVVGVGSVGTRAYVMLLESGDGEPIVLQAKQAGHSVLEPYVGASEFAHSGERVVAGQRAMQSASDPFLGWCHGGPAAPFDFYFRQLWDMKGSIDATLLDEHGLRVYGQICGAVLARAHARAGDASIISGYLGDTTAFDVAIAEFAVSYSAITLADHAALLASGLV
jgi:uncharacterized protein (DUF2252 family)